MNRRVLPNTSQSLGALPEVARLRSDSVVIGVSDLFGETNPFWARTIGDDYLVSILYDELLFSSSNGETGAGIATYTVTTVYSQDRFSRDTDTKITFTIRDGVRYTDGTPLSSDDFINALYLLLMPGFDGEYDVTRAGILGVSEYLQGAAQISGIEYISDRSFSVTFKGENTQNLCFFSFPALRLSLFGDMKRPAHLITEGIFDEAVADTFYRETLSRVRDTDATGMTYGQYILEKLIPGESADLIANTDYWRGAPLIGNAQLLVVPIGSEFQAISEGTVDIISLLGSIDIIDANLEAGFINLYMWEGDVIGYLGMDLENELFLDPQVRHALAIGFDRQKAHLSSIERYGKVPTIILFDSYSSKQAMYEEQYAFDPDKASQLLTDAGWEMGTDDCRYKDGKKLAFTLTYNTPNPVMDRIIPILRDNYRQLGIDMALQAVSFAELIEQVDQGDCEMYFEARRIPNSVTLAADFFAGYSHLNRFRFSSAGAEKALKLSTIVAEPESQSLYLEMMFREVYDQLPFIPLYRRMEMLLVNARVMNVTITTSHDITSDMYRFFLVDTLEGQW